MNSSYTFQSPPSAFKRGRLTKEESTKRALTFSLIVHLGLVAFLVIGISWNNSTPSGVEVELWDSAPQVQTTPEPEVKTVVKEEAADIAVKKKIVEKEPPKKEVVKETPKAVKPPPPKEKEQAKKEEPPKKAEAPKAPSPAETKTNAAAEKVRADQLARLRAAAGAEGGSGGAVGSGIGGGGNTPAGWRDKVLKKVKPLITFNAESVSGNPEAIVQLKLAPDGVILGREIIKSSGIPSFDQALLNAIDRAQTLPKDDNGVIPDKDLRLAFTPKEKK